MDGIIIIKKEKGYTSHDVVAKVKKIIQEKKVGHTGTLDPNATGVLPLLLGQGTKLSQYLIEHDKEYKVILQLGVKTDTADGEGTIIQEDRSFSLTSISEKEIIFTLQSFVGKRQQIPPMYSAIKVNGKKLYEYARKGQKVKVQPRTIEIYQIEVEKILPMQNQIHFCVSCSKGTYIRTLCEDMAQKLGTIGYMKELERTKVGNFRIEQAITLQELQDKKSNLGIITIQEFFQKRPTIVLKKEEIPLYLNGAFIEKDLEDGLYQIEYEGTFQGVGKVIGKKLKREIVLSNNEIK